MKFLVYLALYVVYPLSFLFRRHERRWVFGSFGGAFDGNAKYLFLYCAAHREGERCVWLSKNKATVNEVRRLGLEAWYIASLRGAWYALTSKYWFVNAYTSDIMFAFSGGAVCVNLWHGVGLKRTEFNITRGALAARYVEQRPREVFYHPEVFRRPDWLLSSTRFQTAMFASAFRIPQERCLEVGYPRNAILTCSEAERKAFVERCGDAATRRLVQRIVEGGYNRVYVYMPTWRDSQREIFTQSFDLLRMDAMLKEKGALLLLKPHANVRMKRDEFAAYGNICLVEGSVDVYPVLPYTDVLITDYSSVLYDYVLMPGKEVILYLYDYKEYLDERDLYYPFEENVVGERVYSFEELYACMERGSHAMDEEERQRIVEKFWGDTPGGDASAALVAMVRRGELTARKKG